MVSKAKKSLVRSHVSLPPKMRTFASCLSEHAVKVSDTSCSGGSSTSSSSSSNSLSVVDPSGQNSFTSVYWSKLPSSREFFITVTWSKALSIAVEDCEKHGSASTVVLKKNKGNHSYVQGDSAIGLCWDHSNVKYGSRNEPVSDNFYVVVVVDAEVALLLGGLSNDYVDKKFDEGIPLSEFTMISRKERVVINSVYSTKARFQGGGREHEIRIKCKGDAWDMKESELMVWVDKNKVVCEKRLEWNFRGNQIVFVDGSPVDLMWDVHDWCFGGASGSAVLMLRTRSSLESRLWLEEENVQKEHGFPVFSLLIQACKRP